MKKVQSPASSRHSDSLRPLPEGWIWMQLQNLVKNPKADIVDGPFGSDLKASEYVDAGIPIIRLQNIDRNHFIEKNIRFISPQKAKELQRHSFKKGDIVITKLGNPLGEACIIPDKFETGIIVADVVRVIPEEGLVNKKYLTYAINSQSVIEQFEPLIKGSTRPRVNLSNVRELKIPVAPLHEQKWIVARLEELLSDLETGVRALERVQVGAKRYKASVLKAACEGRLFGEKGTKNGELPKGWRWSTWEEFSPRVTVGFVGKMKDEYVENGIPFLRSQNVRENRFDETGLMYISSAFHKKISKSTLNAGDIVVVRSGSVGVSCVIPESLPESNCSDLVIIKKSPEMVSEFGAYFLNSLAQKYVRAEKVGIALTHFNTKSVAKMPVPLPPMEEQRRIVAEVERRLESVRAIEFVVEAGLKRAGRLRQAVLRSAFEGRLI